MACVTHVFHAYVAGENIHIVGLNNLPTIEKLKKILRDVNDDKILTHCGASKNIATFSS